MKLKRTGDGEYQSECGRIVIRKVLDHSPMGRRMRAGTHPKPLVLWSLTMDGRDYVMCQAKKSDAVDEAEAYLKANPVPPTV